MSATSDFYQAQSDKCTADATASALTQVRDRNLRAAIAWSEMALRAVQTESARTDRERVAKRPETRAPLPAWPFSPDRARYSKRYVPAVP